MSSDPGFKNYVLDQLGLLGNVWARAMFGGYGLYADGLFFAIIADSRLFFRTDDASCEPYLERGMPPFAPHTSQSPFSYYEVPPEILDDQESLVEWAQEAVEVARAVAAVRPNSGPARRARRKRGAGHA